MKKLISLLLGIVILALGFHLTYPANRLKYGRANGSDAKIENVSELSLFLTALQSMKESHVPASQKGTNSTKYDYTSVSMEYIFHYDYSVNDVSVPRKESVRLTETNYVYATREAFCARGTVLMKSSSERTVNGSTASASSFVNEDYSFYADAEKELYRYDDFAVMRKQSPSQNGRAEAYVLPAEYKGTWIRNNGTEGQKYPNTFGVASVSSELTDAFKIVKYCGNYLVSNVSRFSKDEDKYLLLSSYFKDFLQSFPYSDNELSKAESGTFSVDLSDPARPTFRFEAEVGKKLRVSWTIRFTNVNNTFVDLLPTKDEYKKTSDLFFAMGLE